jgi:hypothetical protein
MECNSKKLWETPQLVVFGAVEELTQEDAKYKHLGSQDDFGITGISDA